MFLFFIGIAVLILGYFTYGTYVSKVLAPDDRKTPAITKCDNVDFLCLPHWKNFLIQLLNIAGVGPVIGVILGVKFGAIVFVIIPIGNLIAGATHDLIAGMMSIRGGGANLPKLIKENLGDGFYRIFSVFMMLLLILVVAVFVNIPAELIDKGFPSISIFWLSAFLIFLYYILATLFPIDKIIGRIYPVFGFVLLMGSFSMFVALCAGLFKNPALLTETEVFKSVKWTAENNHPVIPLLFVTIACGIISGFHATQSPIIARTMRSEREAKSSFYGTMVVEGIIAMIWAAAGLAMFNLFPELFSEKPTDVLIRSTDHFLGKIFGGITVISVVILAITSGDTAMRSLRLSAAEIFGISQKEISKRILVCVPIIFLCLVILLWSQADAKSFGALWNYFAWSNQVLACSTLFAATAWLYKQRKNFLIALLPAIFMCFIVASFIIWASPKQGAGIPWGLGLDLKIAYILAGIICLVLTYLVFKRVRK